MTASQWRIEFFGHFTLRSGEVTHTRFATRKVALLLARLAFQKNRQFGREEVIELLWPDSDQSAGRVSLRTALTTLRRQLEPPGSPSILNADHTRICLKPEAFTTDVADFEDHLLAARTSSPAEREDHLRAADALYKGELLPGFYDDWILQERHRLAHLHASLLLELCQDAQASGDWQAALHYVSRCLISSPLEEEAYITQIGLLLQTGRRHAAQEQYARIWQIWEEQLSEPPPAQIREKAKTWELETPALPRISKPRKSRQRKARSPDAASQQPSVLSAPGSGNTANRVRELAAARVQEMTTGQMAEDL